YWGLSHRRPRAWCTARTLCLAKLRVSPAATACNEISCAAGHGRQFTVATVRTCPPPLRKSRVLLRRGSLSGRGGAALDLADPAHQGGGGSRRKHPADCCAAVIRLAAPGLVSPGVRARARSAPDLRSPSLWLTVGQPVAVTSSGGSKGAVCLPGRCGREFRDD